MAVVGSAVSAGLMVITATVLTVDLLRSAGNQGSMDLRLYLLFGGTLAGILLAGLAAWRLLGPIPSTYRRGGLALVCAFATVLMMLICIPINQFFGRNGLVGFVILCGLAAFLLARQASRLRTRA